MQRSSPQLPNDDELPAEGGRAEALWVHGLLRGLADDPAGREARLQMFMQRLSREEQKRRRWPLSARSLIGIGVAAAALVLVVIGLHSGPARANPEMLVRKAQEAHKRPVDRCYLVQYEPGPGVELLARQRDTKIWTRGDRFWLSADGGRLVYGQDEHGGFWVARARKVGIRFEPDENDLPRTLSTACAVYSMRLETLLTEVLRDFDLHEEKPDAGKAVHIVRATLKPDRNHPSVKAALLELDAATNEVRRVVLSRPQATVTFTLAETKELSDDSYKLEGHLEPGAKIYTRSFKPELRGKKLRGE